MPRHKDLSELVGDDVQATPTRTTRRGKTGKPTEGKGTHSEPTRKGARSGGQAGRTGPAKRGKASSTAAAGEAATGADTAAEDTRQSTGAKPEPRVLVPATDNAERASLYLDPDDFRALQLARVDDKVDLNARVRAMIAVWRTNSRVRGQVDRLARGAPRGPHSGRKAQ